MKKADYYLELLQQATTRAERRAIIMFIRYPKNVGRRQRHFFMWLHDSKGKYPLHASDIVCLEARGSSIRYTVKTANGYVYYTSGYELKDRELILRFMNFKRPHDKWLVNLEHFTGLSDDGKSVILCHNLLVPLSQRHKSDFCLIPHD